MIFVSVFDQKLSDKRINTVHYDDADIRKMQQVFAEKIDHFKGITLMCQSLLRS